MPISNIIPNAKNLIAMRTDPDNRPELNRALAYVKDQLKGFTVEDFERNGATSILAYRGDTRPEKFRVILNGHLDVTPGKDGQYEARVEGDRMYGVGSMDMKTNDCVMLEVFKDMVDKVPYPLGLQIVTDEEIMGFNGTGYQVEEGVKADFVIAGETTQFDIVSRSRGILEFKVTAHGVTAHGAYPWRGENAVEKIIKFIDKVYELVPNPETQEWKTSVNLANIEVPNKAYNKVPDVASCMLDIRFTEEDADTILERVKAIVPEDFDFEVYCNGSMLYVDDDDFYLQKIKEAVKKVVGKDPVCYGAYGTSDARFYTEHGMKGVEFGLVGGGIGTDEEWVSIKSAEDFYNVLVTFLESL
ncbi:MAG: M20/M25/M40 family metallo-hydrolase [Firmicutes bacterium]|nr:M20/M25/M40 family metallo-hydrolase [Bacillota bacterium]